MYFTLLCFTILGLLKVCLQNSFIPHKLQSQCGIELLTETQIQCGVSVNTTALLSLRLNSKKEAQNLKEKFTLYL